MDTPMIIIVSVFSGAWLLLLVVSIVLCAQVSSLRKKVQDLSASGRLRIQKLKMNPEGNHAFQNPGLVPDEELSRRGYSMYQAPDEDVESGRGTGRQTSGRFVDELTRELDSRQQRQSSAPPFLLQGIEDKKRNNMPSVMNNGRQSDTNPNFIY